MWRFLFRLSVLLAWSLLLAVPVAGRPTLPGPTLPGPTVRGTLTGADRGPAADVEVELRPFLSRADKRRLLAGGGLDPEPVATAPTGADGRFHLRAPEAGVYRLTVRPAGRLPLHFLPLVLLEDVELAPAALEDDRGLAVRALDSDGRPLAGAWIVASSDATRRPGGWQVDVRLGRTGADGRLAVARGAGERLDLTVVAGDRIGTWSDLAAADSAVLRLTAGDPALHPHPPGLDLLLPDGGPSARRSPPAAVTGRVLARGTGRPLAGAVIWTGPDPGAWVRTDADGSFRLEAPVADGFWLQAEAAGHVPRRRRVAPEDLSAGRIPTLALDAGATVAGRVVDVAGRPVAGVALAARSPRRRDFFSLDPADRRTTSDVDGRFRLDRLRPGVPYVVEGERRGFALGRLTVTPPAAGQLRGGVTLTLARERRVRGRVVDLEGRAVAGAEVILSAAGRPLPEPVAAPAGPAPTRHRARTDAAGRFHTAAPAEEIAVTAFRDGFAPTVVRGIELPPADTASEHDLGTFVLIHGLELTGRVVDPGGRGLAGATVHVVPHDRPGERWPPDAAERLAARLPDAETDADGAFTIGGLTAGQRVHLLASHAGRATTWLRGVDVPARPLEIVLAPAVTLRGRVLDTTGAGVAGAEVMLVAAPRLAADLRPSPTLQEHRRRVTDDDGTFVVDGLAPGRGTFQVSARGFVTPETRELELTLEETPAEIEIALERGAVVAGRVATRGGAAIEGLRVSVGRAAARSDAEGRFRVEGAAFGPTVLETYHPHYPRRRETLEIDGDVHGLELLFPDGVRVAGRLVDESGAPLADARLELEHREAGDVRLYRSRSAADGTFAFEPVADGRYRLALQAEGYLGPEPAPEVRIAGEPVRDLEIAALPETVLGGHVAGLGFDDVARLEIVATSPGRAARRGRVDHRERYEVGGLAPGAWLVVARVGGGRRQVQARIVVPAGVRRLERDLEFTPRLTLAGHARSAGEPLAGALLHLRGYELAVERTVVTDHEGAFRLEDLEVGRYRLSLTDAPRHLVDNRDLVLTGDHGIVVELDPARLGGRVATAGGEALGSALVMLRRREEAGGEGNLLTTGSAADGTFFFPRVPAGRYRLDVRKDGWAFPGETLDVLPGSEERGLELEVRRTGGIELALRPSSGVLPPRLVVAVLDAAGRTVSREARPVDVDGRVRLATVAPGEWRLLAVAPGAAPAVLDVSVAAGVTAEPRELVLDPAGRLDVLVPILAESDEVASLRLLDVHGTPFFSLDEYAEPTSEWPVIGGRATIPHLPAGAWTIEVTSSRGQRFSGAATTRAEPRAEARLE